MSEQENGPGFTYDEEVTMANEIVFEQMEILDAATTNKGLQQGLGQANSKLKRLDDEATRQGYKPKKGPGSEVGFSQRYRAANPVKPGRGEKGEPVQELEYRFFLRELEKPNSRDQAAILTVAVTAGKNTDQYEMLLIADEGKFNEAREYMVENDKVALAESWWSATRDCILSKCGTVCVSSLITCGGTWAAYLLCVAARCGGCWVKCAACATCDCRWWCRWAAGCCHA
jgi:hypothetical protein